MLLSKGITALFKTTFWVCLIVAHDILAPLVNAAWSLVMLVFNWTKKEDADAKFADYKTLKKGGYLNPGGILAGVFGKQRVYFDRERSTIVFGQAGMGKTLLAAANLLAMDEPLDAIVVDPAGDIYDLVAPSLWQHEIIRIDLTDPANSDGYCPLSYPDANLPYDHPRDIISLCDLMMPEGAQMNDVAMHFHESGRNMLKSMLAFKKASFREVIVRMLIEKKLRTQDFAKMSNDKSYIVRQGVMAFDGAGDRERGAMDSTLSRKLASFLDPAILEITDKGNWSFEEKFKGPKPIAVFIKMGLRNRINGGPFARVIVGNALNTVRRMYDLGQKRDRGLLVVLDEARLLENCQPIADAVNELRKARTRIISFWHSYDSVEETYRSAKVFLKGCAWIIFGGSNDNRLYKEASTLAGHKTVKSKSVSKGQHTSETEYENRTALFTEADCQNLKMDELIAIAPGLLAKLKKPYKLNPLKWL